MFSLVRFGEHLLGRFLRFRQAAAEHLRRSPSVHHTTLVRSLVVVLIEVDFQVLLHLLERLVPLGAAGDAEVFGGEWSLNDTCLTEGLRDYLGTAGYEWQPTDDLSVRKESVGTPDPRAERVCK